MNSAVITKIEYRLIGTEEFTLIKNILYSGKLNEPMDRRRAGVIYKTSVTFNVAKIVSENELVLAAIKNRKAQFRLTDGNGVIHLVGDDQYPARLSYQKSAIGIPGGFNGYRCAITCNSPKASTVL